MDRIPVQLKSDCRPKCVGIRTNQWQVATTTNNWTNWWATVALTPGTNFLQSYAVDLSGNVSATNIAKLVFVEAFTSDMSETYLPSVETGRARANVSANGFACTFDQLPQQKFILEASTDLVNWRPLQTNTLIGDSIRFNDPQWTNFTRRFYRVRPQ
jgi:hypothetical protein